MFAAIGRFIKKVKRLFTAIGQIGVGLAQIVAGIGRELGKRLSVYI